MNVHEKMYFVSRCMKSVVELKNLQHQLLLSNTMDKSAATISSNEEHEKNFNTY